MTIINVNGEYIFDCSGQKEDAFAISRKYMIFR